jgi:N-acetylglutamate synthase-like GNAT family acetyltransferase
MGLNNLYQRLQNMFNKRAFELEIPDVRIERFENASFFIDDLFQKSFGQSAPTLPVDYVAFYKSDPSTFKAIGYIHMTEFPEYGLVGGLCVGVDHRHKGLGTTLLMGVERDIKGKKALFVHTSNPTIAKRCGYKRTKTQYLMVKWTQLISKEEQGKLIEEVTKIGPF